MSDIVQKLWGFCHTLRHDGVDYGDYIEQLTYLLFLKMADEREVKVPKGCDWASLKELSGTALTDHYADILRKLREAGGLLADIFTQATPRFNNPVNLKRIITMIDEEDWSSMDVDVKGAAFEGLLEKAASEGKKGAGQYFTPRVLIQCSRRSHPVPIPPVWRCTISGFVHRTSLPDRRISGDRAPMPVAMAGGPLTGLTALAAARGMGQSCLSRWSCRCLTR